MKPGDIVIVKSGWEEAGKTGTCLAVPVEDRYGLRWTLVEWDDEDDPESIKAKSLDAYRTVHEKLRPLESKKRKIRGRKRT